MSDVFDNLDESVIPLEGQDNNEQTENLEQQNASQTKDKKQKVLLTMVW